MNLIAVIIDPEEIRKILQHLVKIGRSYLQKTNKGRYGERQNFFFPEHMRDYYNPLEALSRGVSKKMTKYDPKPLTQDKANPVLLLRVINRIHKNNVVKL